MIEILLTTVAPIALCVALGWIMARHRGVAAAPVAALAVDVLGPALVIGAVPRDLAVRGPLFVLLMASVAVMLAIAVLAAKALRIEDADARTGFLCAVVFANFGFVGLPFVDFLLGPEAFTTGVAVLTFLNVPTGFLAVYLASPHPRPRDAVAHTMRQPFAWAVLLSLVLGVAAIELPLGLRRGAELLGDAAIGVFLLVLGLSLAELRRGRVRWRDVSVALVLRLAVTPLVVVGLAALMGLDRGSTDVRCAVLQLSMPAGLTPLLFMSAFGRNGATLAVAVLVGTLVATVSVPLVAQLWLGIGP